MFRPICEISNGIFNSSVVCVKGNSELRAIKIVLKEINEELVIKPIYFGWNILIHGSPQKKIDWMVKSISDWTKK